MTLMNTVYTAQPAPPIYLAEPYIIELMIFLYGLELLCLLTVSIFCPPTAALFKHDVQWKVAMLMVAQATEVFIGDPSVRPAEDYSQLQLNYQTTDQQFYMEHIAIYNSGVLIFDTVCALACHSVLMRVT